MIQILLATYNSGAFLEQQLASLMEQSCQDFQILVSDGGSRDDTLEIIGSWQKRFPEKIRLLHSSPAAACENFSRLLAAADAELIMFCDHDDVWKKEKITLSVEAYRKMEKEFGADLPILVFTDSEIVDHSLNTLLPSMMRSQRWKRSRFTPGRTVMQNYASGNTMLFNRALQKAALPIGPGAVMHDHWIALAAAFWGKVCYVDIPTILYRQHGSNVLGAFRYDLRSCVKKFLAEADCLRAKIYRNIDQAQELLELHRKDLSQEQLQFLAVLKDFKSMNKLARCRTLLKYGMFKEGMLRNIFMFLIC